MDSNPAETETPKREMDGPRRRPAGRLGQGDGRRVWTMSLYTIFVSCFHSLGFFLHFPVNMTRLMFRLKLYFKTITYMENLFKMLSTTF